MKLLMVSPHLPHPSWGAGTRSYYLLKALAREHVISLLAVTGDGNAKNDGKLLAELTHTLRIVSRSPSSGKRWQQLTSTLRGRSYLLDSYIDPKVQQALDAMVAGSSYDAVLFESVFMAGYRLPKDMPVIIDEHNLEYELLQRTYQCEKGWPRKGYNWWESRLLKPVELERCRSANVVLVTSERERLVLKQCLPETHIEVVPNGVDIDVFDAAALARDPSLPLRMTNNIRMTNNNDTAAVPRDPSLPLRMTNGEGGTNGTQDDKSGGMTNGDQDDKSDGMANEPTIVFTGTMNYYPNIDAVLYFARECWPHIRSRVAGVSWQIVGKDPPPEVRALANSAPGISVTGSVPDVRPYLAKASVAIAPVRIGSGTRLKILEALAMRKAVVSTSLGCEGLAVLDGKHVSVADAAQAFVQAVVDLLQDAQRRTALGNAGRELVEATYSWKRCGDLAVSALKPLQRALRENVRPV